MMHRMKPSNSFSGLAFEITQRETYCVVCGKPILYGFIVARYRGTQSAARNLWYHKGCLENLVSTSPDEKSNGKCLICGEKGTNHKFFCEGRSNYSYGGYHKSCIIDYIKKSEREIVKIEAELSDPNSIINLKNRRKLQRLRNKLKKQETDRVENKSW